MPMIERHSRRGKPTVARKSDDQKIALQGLRTLKVYSKDWDKVGLRFLGGRAILERHTSHSDLVKRLLKLKLVFFVVDRRILS
jgi:hypothetical protein